jgi:hypothetical protein
MSKSKFLRRKSAADPKVAAQGDSALAYRNLHSTPAAENLIRGLNPLPYADRIRE